MRIDPIELSRELISFNTINPPGNELGCIVHLQRILDGAGLETSLQTFAPDRANLIARTRNIGSKLPLCFNGHVDTVPLENTSWSVDPFAGEIIHRKMYGRGSTPGSRPRSPATPVPTSTAPSHAAVDALKP